MKQLTGFILSGIFGGLIALGGFQYFQQEDIRPGDLQWDSPRVQQVADRSEITSLRMPVSFADAAEKATPAVVHIRAAESAEKAQERMRQQQQNHPFYRFFRFEDMIPRDFFGDEPLSRSPRNPEFYQRRGSGSGVIISPEGYVVTNNHVLQFADEITVTLNDNRMFSAELIGRDETTDLAVLKIEATDLPTLEFADSDKSRVGDWVLAVGNPFDYLTSTVTAGIVSAKGRNLNIIDSEGSIEAFIQTDAAVNPGNSGGALVDDQGRLLGINTAIATPTGLYAGYSFAIPINLAAKIVDDIIEHGYYRRAILGVTISEMDASLADEIGSNITTGALIIDVLDQSSASKAGLLPNDIILAVDGKDINSAGDLQAMIGASRAGDTFMVSISRNGNIKNVPVTLIE
nr:trypsin-like peptidase domain-containing protein [Saprospiraceae bacterium]